MARVPSVYIRNKPYAHTKTNNDIRLHDVISFEKVIQETGHSVCKESFVKEVELKLCLEKYALFGWIRG